MLLMTKPERHLMELTKPTSMEDLSGLNSQDKLLVDISQMLEEKVENPTHFSLEISDSEPNNGPLKNSSRDAVP